MFTKHHKSINLFKQKINIQLLKKAEWDAYFNDIAQSNLLQMSSYGEAKNKIEQWCNQYYAFFYEKKLIALCQVLIKKKWLINVVRINRGPLFLLNIDNEIKIAIYQIIGSREFIGKKILLIAPELLKNPENTALLQQAGFKPYLKRSWSSSWVDLRLSEEHLYKTLKSNWRRRLNAANKSSLQFNMANTDEALARLIDGYALDKKIKKYKGINNQFLLAWLNPFFKQNTFFVFEAILNLQSVAALLFVQHGNSCTYVAGWNTEEGRLLNAHNFLYWRAMLAMQKLACQWFDLGGIDEKHTPSIARFKNGLNGKAYSLIGEFIKINF